MTDRAISLVTRARKELDKLTPGGDKEDLWRTIGGVEALLDMALQELQSTQVPVNWPWRTADLPSRGDLQTVNWPPTDLHLKRTGQGAPTPPNAAGKEYRFMREEPHEHPGFGLRADDFADQKQAVQTDSMRKL